MGKYADLLGFLGYQGKEPDFTVSGLEHLSLTGLSLIHCTTAPPYARTVKETIENHKKFIGALERYPHYFKLVLSRRDIDNERLKIICGLQHCPVGPENLDDVSKLQEAGIRVMQMTFGGATPFCGGMSDKIGLTDAGHRLLEKIAEEKIILDLSHAGSAAAVDVVHKAQRDIRLMISHTGCRTIYKHPRNLPDEVLKAVANAGGVIGIYSVTFFLHQKNNSIKPMMDHIRHLIKVAGEDAVAIGSDGLVAGYPNIRDWITHFDWMKEKLDPDGKLGARWPDQPLELSHYDRFSVVEAELRSRGIKERIIEKILGKNAFRFFREALP